MTRDEDLKNMARRLGMRITALKQVAASGVLPSSGTGDDLRFPVEECVRIVAGRPSTALIAEAETRNQPNRNQAKEVIVTGGRVDPVQSHHRPRLRRSLHEESKQRIRGRAKREA